MSHSKTIKLGSAGARQLRTDAFMNVLTGLGTTRDKRTAGVIAPALRLSGPELDDWYAGDSIFAKVVDALPDDMTREGFRVMLDDAAAAEALAVKLRKINALVEIAWAMKLARLHGGAVALLGVDDGRRMDQPVDLENIRRVNFVTALDRWQLAPSAEVYTDPASPKLWKPVWYDIRRYDARQSGETVHESRVLRFDGIRLPDRIAMRNQGWGDPVGNRLYNAIRAYHTAHDSAATIIEDFTQGVYTFKGLAQLLLQGKEGVETVMTRLRELDLGKSIVRSMVLDDGETYQKMSTTVSGLMDLIQAQANRLVAESDMPHTRLLGESPGASLGEGGQSQARQWYDHVAAKQETILRNPLETLVEYVLRSSEGPTGGQLPDGWKLDFNPLWQMDEKDAAEVRYKQAQTDQIYVEIQANRPEEIRDSRFRPEGWSHETTIDRSLDEDLTAAHEEALNGERAAGANQGADPIPESRSTAERPTAP